MRAFLVAAGLLFSAALVSPVLAVSVTMSPPPKVLPPTAPKLAPVVPLRTQAPPSTKTPSDFGHVSVPAKIEAAPPKVAPETQAGQPKPQHQAKATCPCDCPKSAKRQAETHHVSHRRFSIVSYHYASAAPFHPSWRAPYYQPYGARMSYGPSRAYEEGLHIDRDGWSGGVGYAAEGGGGGGFVDGYGQLHFATGNENGPTYNSYNQSFQTNPSQAGPFQPRLMGGFAPSGSGGQ